MAVSYHTGCWSDHWERFGVQFLAQDTSTCGQEGVVVELPTL